MSKNLVLGKIFNHSLSYLGTVIETTPLLTDDVKTGAGTANSYILPASQCLYIVLDELCDVTGYSLAIYSGGAGYSISFYDENNKEIQAIVSPTYVSNGAITEIAKVSKVKGIAIFNTRTLSNAVRELAIYGDEYAPPIREQYLILNNGEYKKFGSEWELVSTTVPTAEEFINSGHKDLSLFNRSEKTLSNQFTKDVGYFRTKINLHQHRPIKKIEVK